MPKIVLKSFFVTAAALASALGLVGSASAAGTWTVSGFPPSGTTSGTSTNSVLADTNTGTQLKCTTTTITVTGMNGTFSSGTGLIHITAVTWSGCSGPLGITFTVTAQNLPWNFNAVSYNAMMGITSGTLTGVEAHISGVGCTADIRGTTSTTPATLNATYTNSSHKLSALSSGTDLHVYNVSGSCAGLLNSGDAVTYAADYVLSDPVTITSM